MQTPRVRGTHFANRRLRPVPLLLPLLAVSLVAFLASGAGASLPPQASEAGHDHAHSTHGPDGLALDRRGRTPGDAPFAVDAHAEWQSCEYDGVAPSIDSTDLPELKNRPQVHAIYVHPAKTASRFPAYAAMFQADARQASAMLQTLGRDIRWDLRLPVGALCSGTTVLDITVFKSRYSAGQLSGGNQFSLVANELAASKKFSVATKKYVIWLDAGSQYCGQGTLYQDTRRAFANYNNANRTTGIVYRPYSTTNGEGGFCRGRTLLHELGHNLGALQRGAPHAYDGAHCNDDDNDVMCYIAEATHDSGAAQFDYGKDDYWDLGASMPTATNNGYPELSAEKLGGGLKPAWWALNLSKYICPPGAVGSRPNCAIDNLVPGY
jgi:hypothetical protein